MDAQARWTSWDVASEFTDQTNGASPSVWNYCEEATLNASCVNLTAPYNPYSGNVLGWADPSNGTYPFVAHNVNQTNYVESGVLTMSPHGIQMHPGPGPTCAYAVARFTAPHAGKYHISGQFFGLDDNGTKATVDVEVSINSGTPVFAGNIDLNVNTMHYASFTTIVATLAANDHVDFQVGCGPNGDYNYDSTGLNAVVEWKGKIRR